MIPQFDSQGHLPTGLHTCSGNEFIERFCAGERKHFTKPISDILDFAKDRNALYVFVGGSFVTKENSPNDIDCVLVFKEDKYIPHNTEKISIRGLKIDVLFASLESRNTVDTYLKLFSSGRYGMESIGVIQIDLYDRNQRWEIMHEPDEGTMEIVKRAYNDRALIDINERMGILVTIHGLFSRGEWNQEIAHISSNQGWIFAPFVYEKNKPDLLFSEGTRNKVVEQFRHWIYDIQRRYDNNSISIIAHSFGTFVVAKYLAGFDEKEYPPVSFNSLILTGSILNVKFDWEKYRGHSVGSVYNMIAPKDEWVKFMPDTDLKRYIGMDPLFGSAGLNGFENQCSIVTQSTNEIFTHTNTIKRDIIETKWMPFLNANRWSLSMEASLKRQKKL